LLNQKIEQAKLNEKITENDVQLLKDDSNNIINSSSNTVPIEEEYREYLPALTRIFEHYASMNENYAKDKLKNGKYIKMLIDCKLLKPMNEKLDKYPLTKSTADVIYSQILSAPKTKSITSPKSKSISTSKLDYILVGDMNFTQFLYALKSIACKLDIDIFASYLLKLDIAEENKNKSLFLTEATELIKGNDMKNVFDVMHRLLMPLYINYCDSKKQIDLNKFIKFAADFDIFPTLLSKPVLAKVFAATADNMIVDEKHFTQAIALCSMEVIYQPSVSNYKEKVKH